MNGGVELKIFVFGVSGRAPVSPNEHKRDPLLWTRNWVFLNGNLSIFHRILFFDGTMGWGWRIHCDEIRMKILPLCLPLFPILACRVLVKEINGFHELIAVEIFCKTRLEVKNILMDIAHLLPEILASSLKSRLSINIRESVIRQSHFSFLHSGTWAEISYGTHCDYQRGEKDRRPKPQPKGY